MSNTALATTGPQQVLAPEQLDQNAKPEDVQGVVQFVNEQDDGVAYGQPRVYARIKGDRLQFMMPGAEEPVFKAEQADVVVVAGVRTRALRLSKDDKFPVCASNDGGKSGHLSEGAFERHPDLKISDRQQCDTCPYNVWGTGVNDKGEATRGKACRERRNLLLVHPEFAVPVILGLPPTSIGPWDTYAQSFIVRRPKSSYIAHVTRIGVATETGEGGNEWGVAKFGVVRAASPNEVLGAAQIRETYRELLLNYEDAEEAAVAPDAPPPPDDESGIPFE